MMRDSLFSNNAFVSDKKLAYPALAAAGIVFLFLNLWHWWTTGDASVRSFGALLLLLTLYLGYGCIFSRVTSNVFGDTTGLPYQILTGYFFSNTLLFFLSLASPFGMSVNLTILTVLMAVGVVSVRRRNVRQQTISHEQAFAPIVAIVVAALGATIWCSDIQAPVQVRDGTAVFQVWRDVYIHVREISVFAQAHGINTIHDIKMAGGPAPIYHFTSYLSPAAVHYLSGASAMQVYASFQLPLGIFFTGIAAYCLIGNFFGRWAGVAAVVAVVLLPDGYQQGFANRYLSYNFLAQVNLGMLYGIACAALAWLFVLDGCRRKAVAPVILGYGFLAFSLIYKAHIFVANSYLMLIYPVLFFPGLRLRWRVAIGVGATLLFVAIVTFSQQLPRIPVLRLDGSGIGSYIMLLLTDYDPGILKTFFTKMFVEEQYSAPVDLLFAVVMLLMSTFGYWTLILPVAIGLAWRQAGAAITCFPLLVVANYMVMTIGLAPDTRKIGTWDEMLNRPLVWAYFIVAAWSAGLLYYRFVGVGLPRTKPGRGLALAAVAAAVCVTAYIAPNLQTFPTRKGYATYSQSSGVPACVVKSAEYLRANSAVTDVVQDAAGDPRFMFTALSERQLFVGSLDFGGKSKELKIRINDIKQFEKLEDKAQVSQFARARGIQWYLASPTTELAWPQEIANYPAFTCGGYRLYNLSKPLNGQPN